MSDVTREWLEKLPKLTEAQALTAIRDKSAELYRAQHGRDPKDAEERRVAMELLTAEADRVRERAAVQGDGSHLPGFAPITRGAMRELLSREDKAWAAAERGW